MSSKVTSYSNSKSICEKLTIVLQNMVIENERLTVEAAKSEEDMKALAENNQLWAKTANGLEELNKGKWKMCENHEEEIKPHKQQQATLGSRKEINKKGSCNS